MEGQKQCYDSFEMLKESMYKPGILYPGKITFKTEDEIKIFSKKQKQRTHQEQTGMNIHIKWSSLEQK